MKYKTNVTAAIRRTIKPRSVNFTYVTDNVHTSESFFRSNYFLSHSRKFAKLMALEISLPCLDTLFHPKTDLSIPRLPNPFLKDNS
jgi:hypothetical protein